MTTRPYKAATESARAEWTPEVREFRERLAFTAPLWPLGLAYITAHGFVRLVRLAFGGAR